MIELRNWTLCAGGNGYTAPEHRALCAGGEVDFHPALGTPKDGDKIQTSAIVSAEGNILRTQNSTYVLIGPPSDFFVESVLEKHGLSFDGDLAPIVDYLHGK